MRSLYFIFLVLILNAGSLHAQIVMHNGEEIDSVLLSPECKPAKDENGRIFTGLEIPAEFKGGPAAWFKYCNTHFNFDAVESKLPDSVNVFTDSVTIKFVVTRKGDICQIQYLRGNKLLLQPTLELIRGTAAWIPGQNGSRYVHSFRTLCIDVHIDRINHVREVVKKTFSYWKYNDREIR